MRMRWIPAPRLRGGRLRGDDHCLVIPAKAGIQSVRVLSNALGPRLREDDGYDSDFSSAWPPP